MLRPAKNAHGYIVTVLSRQAVRQTVAVHILVAREFMGPRPSQVHQVNHVNGDKTDNRVANLEWVTGSANIRHRFDVLKKGNRRGEAHSMAKLTETKVREIRSRVAAGESQGQVAADYGVDRHQVSKVYRGVNWGWVQ